jgi:DNA (cytosine-5)-methyltransferase 1
MNDKIKAISLFSGCGGADLGLIGGFTYLNKYYGETGIEIIHASDIDQKAVNTYNANFKHKAICEDVLALDFSGMKADIVMGGFPCQNFSTVNPTKNPEDRNNQLFWELTKVTKQVMPKVVIGENVQGFYYLKKGKYFKLIEEKLQSIGYTVYAKILNSADYGIPQLRKRLIIIAVRNDIKNIFHFPSPTHGDESKDKSDYVPLNKVIKSLYPENEKYFFSKRAVEGVKRAKPNMKRALAQDLQKPCLTITSHLAKVSLNSRDPVLLVDEKRELYRRFTPSEAALIQSFPTNFKFVGSEGDTYRQVGNAIPPVLLWKVTQSLLSDIFQINNK